MKFEFKSTGIIILFIFSYISYVVILAVLKLPNPIYTSKPDDINYNEEIKPIDASIPDSLSQYKFRKLMDSIRTVRDLKNGDYFPDAGVNFINLIAVGRSIECDTCSVKWFKETYLWERNSKPLNVLYYIQLPSWKLNEKFDPNLSWTKDSVQFYVERGQAYVRKFISNPNSLKTKNHQSFRLVDIPVKFRYNRRGKCVMIPVSKTTQKSINIVFGLLAISFLGYLIILIGKFIGFITDISKGLAFTNKNLKTLKLIAITLLAIPFVELLFNLIVRLIFHSYLTSDVVLNLDIVDGYWKLLMIGVIFLMIYRAFKQGKALKDEQELTV